MKNELEKDQDNLESLKIHQELFEIKLEEAEEQEYYF